MLFSRLINSGAIRGKNSLGITVNILSDNELDFDFVLLSRNKNSINIEKSGSFDNFDDLEKENFKNIPLYLTIIGKGIIYRRFNEPVSVEDSDNVLLNKIIPGAKPDDFHLQKDNTYSGYYVNLIRKSPLEHILKLFLSGGYQVFDISIGPFALNSIANFIGNNEISCKGLTILVEDNVIHSIESSSDQIDRKYRIEDVDISSDIILSFAHALTFYNSNFYSETRLPELLHLRQEFLYKQLFTLGKWTLLTGVFMILLLNFIFYGKYNQKINTLSTEYNSSIDGINKLKKMSEQIREQENFILENNLDKPSKSSYYIDRLATLRPSKISLKQIIICPLQSDIKPKKKIEHEENKIIIEGTVSQGNDLSNWVRSIEKETWVKTVDITSFKQNDKKRNADFTLELFYTE
jgi:hypothetical protein